MNLCWGKLMKGKKVIYCGLGSGPAIRFSMANSPRNQMNSAQITREHVRALMARGITHPSAMAIELTGRVSKTALMTIGRHMRAIMQAARDQNRLIRMTLRLRD